MRAWRARANPGNIYRLVEDDLGELVVVNEDFPPVCDTAADLSGGSAQYATPDWELTNDLPAAAVAYPAPEASQNFILPIAVPLTTSAGAVSVSVLQTNAAGDEIEVPATATVFLLEAQQDAALLRVAAAGGIGGYQFSEVGSGSALQINADGEVSFAADQTAFEVHLLTVGVGSYVITRDTSGVPTFGAQVGSDVLITVALTLRPTPVIARVGTSSVGGTGRRVAPSYVVQASAWRLPAVPLVTVSGQPGRTYTFTIDNSGNDNITGCKWTRTPASCRMSIHITRAFTASRRVSVTVTVAFAGETAEADSAHLV